MAKLIWTEPALQDLLELADYVALENQTAAKKLVQAVFESVEMLIEFPNSGRKPPELPDSPYREKVVPPVRVFYRVDGEVVYIIHVMRVERDVRKILLS